MCIYNVAHQILLKKFQISRNLAYDGMMVSSVCVGPGGQVVWILDLLIYGSWVQGVYHLQMNIV